MVPLGVDKGKLNTFRQHAKEIFNFLKATNKEGLSLLEILVSVLILALVMIGLANIFVAGKRHILYTRSRMTGGELGRYFLDPLQMDVRQDEWGNNCLSAEINCPGAQPLDNITYTPNYECTPDAPIPNINRVKVDISWPPATP